ncbi:hypothetical protein RM190_08460 [Paracoccus sp. CPCC 101403]|uniref:Uncharacterized protein n=2 Tax=Paracoccus broussonetiae TaxID=3075834 RepID=A0ABU3ECL2_9RHOB|nr:hypothetical protein [Paracoccus sp. CPCC 101403]
MPPELETQLLTRLQSHELLLAAVMRTMLKGWPEEDVSDAISQILDEFLKLELPPSAHTDAGTIQAIFARHALAEGMLRQTLWHLKPTNWDEEAPDGAQSQDWVYAGVRH